jgi:hypothetical protein
VGGTWYAYWCVPGRAYCGGAADGGAEYGGPAEYCGGWGDAAAAGGAAGCGEAAEEGAAGSWGSWAFVAETLSTSDRAVPTRTLIVSRARSRHVDGL